MASIFTPEEKSELAAMLHTVHDTFARPITVYQDGTKILVSTDPNFNPLYRRNTSNVEVTPVATVINARVQYGRDQEFDAVTDSSLDFQTKINFPIGYCRIKVDTDGYELLKDAKRIEVDGKTFTVLSSNRPHGLFESTYYTFLLQPTDAEK